MVSHVGFEDLGILAPLLAELRNDSARLAEACNAAGKACFTAWPGGLSR